MLDKQGCMRARICIRPRARPPARARTHTHKYVILLFHGNNDSWKPFSFTRCTYITFLVFPVLNTDRRIRVSRLKCLLGCYAVVTGKLLSSTPLWESRVQFMIICTRVSSLWPVAACRNVLTSLFSVHSGYIRTCSSMWTDIQARNSWLNEVTEDIWMVSSEGLLLAVTLTCNVWLSAVSLR
jgi:hypothetical protein